MPVPESEVEHLFFPASRIRQVFPIQGQKQAEQQHSEQAAPFPWILSPALDLLLCCGGMVWIIGLTQFFVVDLLLPQFSANFAIAILACSHLFAESHIAATWFRIYSEPKNTRSYSIALIGPSLVLLLCFAGLSNYSFTAFMCKIYTIWVAHHFTSQTYGITLLYCIKNGCSIDAADKFVLRLMMNSVAAVAVTRQLTDDSWAVNQFIGVELPKWSFVPPSSFVIAVLILQVSVCIFAVRTFSKVLKGRKCLPVPAMLMILTIVATFTAGNELFAELRNYLPAYFHASQYLAITGAAFLMKGESAKHLPPNRKWLAFTKKEAVAYFAKLFICSGITFLLLPALLSLCVSAKEQAFAAVFCAVNLHHFISDMLIWKLRNPAVQNSLVR